MRREEFVDYHLVPDSQLAIHERLTDWARWVRVRPHGWQVAPMFRHFRREEGPVLLDELEARRAPRVMVNMPQAVEMEKAVSLLPEKHREAVRWCYLWATVPRLEAKMNGWEQGPPAMAKRLGVSKEGLLDLIQTGRSMLRNRGL